MIFDAAIIAFFFLILSLAPQSIRSVNAGTYLNSAHGNSSYGVNRTSTSSLGYARANCAHCHEQHASIDGSEPAPTGGPSKYMLFYDTYVSQTDSICYKCHTDSSSLQSGGLVNRSYSYRAGGWTADTVNDVQEAFSFISPGVSHSLADIQTFIAGKWGYTADSTPCIACHNPHAAQGDPANAGNAQKTAAARGWPVSRPSQHSGDDNAWGLWGDDAAERMSAYTGGYQAPYRYYTTTPSALEPQGDAIAAPALAAQNTTDYVTFCTDCHNATNTIYSTALGRNLRTIDWDTAKHGKGAAVLDSGSDILPPYQNAQLGSYVLACTDCHEPHGSANVFFLRGEVNGGAPVTVLTADSTNPGPDGTCNKEWVYLCGKCHTRLGGSDGHVHPSYVPPDTGGCSSGACHSGSCIYTPCGTCHYHGANTVFGTPYGENLF